MGKKKKAAAVGVSLTAVWMFVMTLSQLAQNIDYAAYSLFNIQIPLWVTGVCSLVCIPFLVYFLLKGGNDQ